MEEVFKITGLEKYFGQNHVLQGINMSLPMGCVSVLMGANGAGKSTLVKIICGYYSADAGIFNLVGNTYKPHNAADAIAQGIVTVHQSIDDGVIPDLDVANNLMFDQLSNPNSRLFVRERLLREGAQKIAASMGLKLEMRTRVSDLSLADRQMIAIARAMAHSPKVLILDEPTSSLSINEAERLFSLIDRLKRQGVAILYISHRMSDIRRIADRIICMRDGKISNIFEQQPLNYDNAVIAMLGRDTSKINRVPIKSNNVILKITDIKLQDGSTPISMTAHGGEIVAVIGLLGSGKSKLAEIISGIAYSTTGHIQIDGMEYTPTSVREAIARGVFMSPKDRTSNAVIPSFDIANNMTLPFLKTFSTGSFLRSWHQRRRTNEMVNQMGIVCQSSLDGIGSLSGGNQQKVMIARWLLKPARVLILDEPFQGVDIGARHDIGHQIRSSAKGRATLVFMAEIDEALEIADRIIILNEGSITGEYYNENIDLSVLMTDFSGITTNRITKGKM